MKSKVSKRLFKDLKFLEDNWDFENIIKSHSSKKFSVSYSKEFRELTLKELVNFLINGYEIEETSEDKLLKIFNYNQEKGNEIYLQENSKIGYYHNGFAQGIKLTLETLNIKIKGINE